VTLEKGRDLRRRDWKKEGSLGKRRKAFLRQARGEERPAKKRLREVVASVMYEDSAPEENKGGEEVGENLGSTTSAFRGPSFSRGIEPVCTEREKMHVVLSEIANAAP